VGLEAGPWDSRNDHAVHGGVERRREARGGRAQHLVRAQRDLECRTIGPPQMLDARAARASRAVPGSRRHRIRSTIGVPPARILPIKEVLHHPANPTQRSLCAPLRGRTPSLRLERRRRCGQAPPAAPRTPEDGTAPARAPDAAHANKHTHTRNATRVRARCGGGQLWGPGRRWCFCRNTPPLSPASRTKWTRLVHPSVLIGHVSTNRRTTLALNGFLSQTGGVVGAGRTRSQRPRRSRRSTPFAVRNSRRDSAMSDESENTTCVATHTHPQRGCVASPAGQRSPPCSLDVSS
jgi:hypothetical protein